jgi:hypothetical protein
MPTDRLPTWLLPEIRLASRPALLSLVLLLLFGLGAVLACWSTRDSTESAESDLNTGHTSPKLDITSAESPPGPSAAAIPSEADETGWIAHAPQAPNPGDTPAVLEIPAPDSTDSAGAYKIPDLQGAPAVEPPSSPQVEPVEPAPLPAPIDFDAGNLFNSSSRGDTPMIRTWKMLGYPAILAAAFATAPQLTWADEKTGQGSDAKAEPSMRDLKESLEAIKRTLNTNVLNCSVLDEKVSKLSQQVAQLQKDVDSIRSRTTSTSNYQSIAPAPATGSGRIHLVNTWPQNITVFLNDKAYAVAANREITITDVPAGNFTYEVIEQRPDNVIQPITQKLPRSLGANETFTIHVHPR